MFDCHTLIISDIHLGARVCRVDKVLKLLQEATFAHLIINGDLFDSNSRHRLNQKHQQVVALLENIAKKKKVTLISGNHGRKLDLEIGKTGIEIRDDLIFTIGDNRFLCIHGDQFDFFTTHLPRTSKVAGDLYHLLQKFSGSQQRFSMLTKRLSKYILRVPSRQQKLALRHATKHDISVIICSHTHLPHQDTSNDVHFINTGSFCETPCHFVTIDEQGKPQLQSI